MVRLEIVLADYAAQADYAAWQEEAARCGLSVEEYIVAAANRALGRRRGDNVVPLTKNNKTQR